jgi:polysaccharide deacetylase 2 family uncharacterized protein YibQ
MPADDLTKPLGLSPPRKPRGSRLAIAAAAIVLVAGAGGGYWLLRSPGPSATAPIAAAGSSSILADRTASVRPPPAPASAPQGAPAGLTPLKPTGSLTDTGRVVIYDPSQPPPIALSATPDPALVEDSSHGPLPKVAANGRRPLDAYARPVTRDDGGSRLVIIVGGVGIDPASTGQAINALPGPVTLAFAPYSDGLQESVAAARAVGHEVLLQLPMEPYGYPKTNPGPQTLTTGATPRENLDRLYSLMGRATNYVGVVNYMGARFTSETPAMTALLTEIGKRGLAYVDDGSSPRSVAADVARGRAPFAQADLVLDPDLSATAIDARLAQLAAIARERGYAVATATAFPITIERIAAFARTAADNDLTLVPLSALVAAGRT